MAPKPKEWVLSDKAYALMRHGFGNPEVFDWDENKPPKIFPPAPLSTTQMLELSEYLDSCKLPPKIAGIPEQLRKQVKHVEWLNRK